MNVSSFSITTAIAALIMSGLFAGSAMAAPKAEATKADNKKLVVAFYDLAFNKHKPREAAEKYIGKRYVQHNPHAKDGAEEFATYFEAYFQKFPESHVEIKQVLADDDLVVLHLHSKEKLDDKGAAVVDIFRVEKGKIVEHWDVIQPITEDSANPNTMF